MSPCRQARHFASPGGPRSSPGEHPASAPRPPAGSPRRARASWSPTATRRPRRRWRPTSTATRSRSTSPTSAEVRRAFANVREARGPIDVLVNNAGGDRAALFLDSDEADWDATLALNLKSVVACTHAALATMVDRRRGAIVNVASEAGRVGMVGRRAVHGGQGRRDRVHQGHRTRGCPLRRALQRRGARADRHAATQWAGRRSTRRRPPSRG